jgi:uncharacterized protein (TIGR00251 family)
MAAYKWSGADLELQVRAQPGAKRTEAAGPHGEALKIRVCARAVEGAANEALLEFLAGELRVPLRRCSLLSGQTGRQKRVLIEAPEREHAEAVLRSWLHTSS